jgi:peptidoglycan/LPS O-acetylase OafA/YrhL
MSKIAVREIKPLTGVRIVAAMAVVLLHQKAHLSALAPSLTWIEPLLSKGKLAVPFFFILSGFILSHVYFPSYSTGTHWKFVWLRFSRLWPVHVAMFLPLLIYVGCLTVVRGYQPHPKFDFSRLVPDIAMVRGWYDPSSVWNFPAWSIEAEWFAYIVLFPICAVFIKPIRSRWVLGFLALGLLVTHPYVHYVLPGQTGAILCLFLAGSATYNLGRILPSGLGAKITIAGLVLCVVGLFLASESICYVSFAAIILGLYFEEGWVSRILSHRVMVYGGTISFSLYMVHYSVNVWMGEAEKYFGIAGLELVAVSVLGAIIAAAVVHHLVEIPANRWLRSKIDEPARTPNREYLTPNITISPPSAEIS